MKLLFGIGVGGFLGTVARFWLTDYISRKTTISFPYGTALVNVLGSFALGFVIALSLRTLVISDITREIVAIGFLGAFTTMSTFSYETFRLMGEGSYALAAINILFNLMGCLLATALGWGLAKLLTGGSL